MLPEVFSWMPHCVIICMHIDYICSKNKKSLPYDEANRMTCVSTKKEDLLCKKDFHHRLIKATFGLEFLYQHLQNLIDL